MSREYVPKIINGQVKHVKVGKLPKILIEPGKYCGWCGHRGIWLDNKYNWHCQKCHREWSEE